MAVLMGDVGFPSAAGDVAADMKQSGMRWIGLYAANWSAPGTVQSAGYMAAVEQAYGARCVAPIVTPGNTPPQLRGLGDRAVDRAALRAYHDERRELIRQGVTPRVEEGLHEDLDALAPIRGASTVAGIIQALGMAGRWVPFDIETYSFPSIAWLQTTFAALREIGCRTMIYGLRTTLTEYAPAAPDGWWVADWSGGTAIPSDCLVRQVGDSMVINGRTYDADWCVDGWDPTGAPVAVALAPDTQQQMLVL
jgi:hypothetical protein